MNENVIRTIVFIGRCAGAATLAYELASLLGLPDSLWATMVALIVSQERLDQTQSSLTGYILGTLFGIAVTVATSAAASFVAVPMALQIAVSVAVSAVVARAFPKLRVAMWTCPIILLTAQHSEPIPIVALHRGSEVILGAMVGWAFHWAAEILPNALAVRVGDRLRRRWSPLAHRSHNSRSRPV